MARTREIIRARHLKPPRSLGGAIAAIWFLAACWGFSGLLTAREADHWLERSYCVSFEWNDGLKSVDVKDARTGKPESDRVLRRIVSDGSEHAVSEIIKRTELKKAEGRFNLTLRGSMQPYLMSWSNADIPKLDQLMEAAATWDLQATRRIIGEGMEINARALDSGNTALILAASDPFKTFSRTRVPRFKSPPDKRTVGYLLTSGADPNVKGYLGATALMRSNDAWIAQALISHGADVNAKDSNGWNAVVHAIQDHNQEILQLLIKANADLNARDNKGWTPLMVAVDEGSLNATKLLVESGADVRLTNSQGETALVIAREKRKQTRSDTEIIDMLSAASPSQHP